MASESAPVPPSSVRRPRFTPVTHDLLSRVIYTQAFTALKPLRTANLDDPKALAASLAEHHSQLGTVVSTISAADTEDVSDQQKLAINLGKLTALFSKRLVTPLNETKKRPRPTAPQATVTTAARKREAPPPVVAPVKKIKDEPLDEDEPCCSTSIAATTNETLSSLLDAQLKSLRNAAAPPQPLPQPPRRAAITVRAAKPGAAPVKVVVAARNGAPATRVVAAIRRPAAAPGQRVAATTRPTVPATIASKPKIALGTRPRPPSPATVVGSTSKATVPTPPLRAAVVGTAGSSLAHNRCQKLSKRLRIQPNACYGICDVDKPEKHPTHACPFCGLMIEGSARLEHVKETHPDRYAEFTPFICILKECDYRATSRAEVKKHCMQVHSPLFDLWQAKGRFNLDADAVCPLCDDPYPVKTLTSLRMHAREKHDMMPTILCSVCCETCTTTSELFLHWVHSPFCDGNAKLLDCRQESFLALFN